MDWLEVRTRDRDEIAAALNSITVHRARITVEQPDRLDLHVRLRSGDDLAIGRVRLCGVGYAAETDPVDYLLAGCVVDGHAEVHLPGHELTLAGSAGFLYPLGVPITGEYGHSTTELIKMPVAYAARIAEASTGLPAADLRFESPRPVSAAMARYWAATVAFLSGQLTAPDADIPPLVLEQLSRLAASAMLAVYPNTSMNARRPREGRVAPAAVRRATAFMDANSDRTLTVADVADAAGVGARALQSAFRRHLDITPLGYLRRVRLERVHRELQDADPAAGVTVRAAARRWGFANPSRFAADYRAAFGQTPSRTLRT